MLSLLLQGLPNKLIARELNLSVETVKDHVAAVLRALGVSSRTQAVLAVSQMQQQAAQNARQPPNPDTTMSAALPALPAAPGATAAPVSRRFDHVRALFVQTPATLIGNLVGWCLIALMFWPLAAPAPLLAWMVAAALLWLLRLAHYLRYQAHRRSRRCADAALAPELEACWCWRRRRCGAWPCGCSGAWARRTT